MRVLETERLILRQLEAGDAPFILELLNEDAFLHHIGDRGVRDLESARRYIEDGPRASYARHGFGLWWIGLKERGEALGICGLLKRDYLEDPDIGYALLTRHESKGYAVESASAVLDHGMKTLALPRVVALTTRDNRRSIQVLERIGLRFERLIRVPGEAEDSAYFTTDPLPR